MNSAPATENKLYKTRLAMYFHTYGLDGRLKPNETLFVAGTCFLILGIERAKSTHVGSMYEYKCLVNGQIFYLRQAGTYIPFHIIDLEPEITKSQD